MIIHDHGKGLTIMVERQRVPAWCTSHSGGQPRVCLCVLMLHTAGVDAQCILHWRGSLGVVPH